ncbi:hypothetical protein ACG7TL_008375 [Trametes sanguinea]
MTTTTTTVAILEETKEETERPEPLPRHRPRSFTSPLAQSVIPALHLATEDPPPIYASSPTTHPIVPAIAQDRASPAAPLRTEPAAWIAGSANGQEVLAAGRSFPSSSPEAKRQLHREEPASSGDEPMVAVALPYNIAERVFAFLESNPVQSHNDGMVIQDLEAPPAYEPRSTDLGPHSLEQD